MELISIEIKAKCRNPEFIRGKLHSRNAEFKGVDHQIDTYFKIESGRLKLREGNIENNLIYYNREDLRGPKRSDVALFKVQQDSGLKKILSSALGILVAVEKKREIYFIQNIKFHIDDVKDLGSFVEIEAIDKGGKIEKEELLEQCRSYMHLFEIEESDLVNCSYSDLLLEGHNLQP